MKLLIIVKIVVETIVIHQNKAGFMQKFTLKQKTCFSLAKINFIKNTSGPEGLIAG